MKRLVGIMVVIGMAMGFAGSYGMVSAEEKKAAAPAKAAQVAADQKRVKTILDFKSELNLTESQTQRIREQLNNLDKDVRVMRANLSNVNLNYQNLMEKEADIAEIKKKIRESFDIQANMRIVDLETARNINKILSPDQLKKWKAIRNEAKNRQGNSTKK